MNMRTLILSIFAATAIFGNVCHAEDADSKANYFANLYVGLCMKNLNDLESLRANLARNNLPKLPPEKAALFLQNKEGDAWPVPFQGQLGNFVVTLLSGKNFCAVLARRASQTDVEHQFIQLVSKAPTPLISEVKLDEYSETALNGKTHTISYTWSLPQAHRKMLFTLTTAPSETAQLQAMASAAIISE
jgi:hypothetical protein